MLAQDRRPELAPTLDEERVLYTFFLRAPHAPEAVRARFDAARRGARDAAACRAIDEGERMAAEAWRATKIRALGAIDPAYPTPFALGVALQRAGEAPAASAAFRAWLDAHPDGPWTLRARNHLRAALDDVRRD